MLNIFTILLKPAKVAIAITTKHAACFSRFMIVIYVPSAVATRLLSTTYFTVTVMLYKHTLANIGVQSCISPVRSTMFTLYLFRISCPPPSSRYL